MQANPSNAAWTRGPANRHRHIKPLEQQEPQDALGHARGSELGSASKVGKCAAGKFEEKAIDRGRIVPAVASGFAAKECNRHFFLLTFLYHKTRDVVYWNALITAQPVLLRRKL